MRRQKSDPASNSMIGIAAAAVIAFLLFGGPEAVKKRFGGTQYTVEQTLGDKYPGFAKW